MTDEGRTSQLFAVLSRPVGTWTFDEGLTKQHVEFLSDLESSGITFLSGPIGIDDEGWHGEGITVIRARSHDHAVQIMSAEPYYVAGARTHDIKPWLITSGRVAFSFNVSDLASSIA